MIRETHKGYYDRTTFQGDLTRYKPTQRLIERIEELESNPTIPKQFFLMYKISAA